VNVNPMVNCNFLCRYCEVERTQPGRAVTLDVDIMATELLETIRLINEDRLRLRSRYSNLPKELLDLRHVALSGDGEPTLAPKFVEATQAVVGLRATGQVPYFKIVLLTNSTNLDKPEVEAANLKVQGAEISLVQIYSATRPMARSGCTHLSLKSPL
jgi:wyosine [tRNA(Phe)-imidazoG37] synthetase (radical SAM superfamily)